MNRIPFVNPGIVSQSVSFFTVPPRARPSTGSQSGSATPGLTQVPSTRSRGGYSIVASEVNLSQQTGIVRSSLDYLGLVLGSLS